MRKPVLSILLCAGVVLGQSRAATEATFTPTVAAPELRLEGDNLSPVKGQLVDYVRSGRYSREIGEVSKAAHDWLETRVAHTVPGEKLAAVFDIDETALSNLPNMADCDFCSTAAQARLYPQNKLPAITPVHDLYNFAKSKGVAVILVTGRYESGRDITASELQTAGYSGWADLLMRLNGNSDPARIMKADIRAGVERKGYKIILNIGDQLSDLIGGYSERTYKLPNPFYFVE